MFFAIPWPIRPTPINPTTGLSLISFSSSYIEFSLTGVVMACIWPARTGPDQSPPPAHILPRLDAPTPTLEPGAARMSSRVRRDPAFPDLEQMQSGHGR